MDPSLMYPPYNPNNNSAYFLIHDNEIKYILIRLKLALHQLNKYGIDKFTMNLKR